MIEVWSPVAAWHEDMFAVSSEGRVMNLPTEEIMTQYEDVRTGEMFVQLNHGGYSVAELVAEAYICCLDCEPLEIVHVDGDQTNNAVWNLILQPGR